MHLSSLQLACAALATLALAAAATVPQENQPHHVARRSFFNLQCRGVYDASIFNRLDRICDDCYNLFRESQVYSLCRANCFTTAFFKGCLESLYLHDEEERFDEYIDYIGKR